MPSISMHRAWRHLDSASSLAARGLLGLKMPCEEGHVEEAQWSKPFWSGGRARPLRWTVPEHQADSLWPGVIDFEVALVEPDRRSTVKLTAGLPLVFYFSGVGGAGGMSELDLAKLSHVTPCAFVVVAAKRQPGYWWFLDNDKEWGWIDGNFQPTMVDLVVLWMHRLASEPGIDRQWVSAFGFSAGAYGLTELLARSQGLFRSLALGGLHGHAQPDMEGIVGKRAQRPAMILNKWRLYLARLSHHIGVPGGIYVMHNEEDTMCPWNYAQEIVKLINARQRMARYPEVIVEHLGNASKKAKVPHHSYFNQAFMRKEVFQRLLPAAKETQLAQRYEQPAPAPGPAPKRARVEVKAPPPEAASSSSAAPMAEAAATALIERAKPVERSSLLCANADCVFLVHKSPALGGFCCKNCHWKHETGSSYKGKAHGSHCQKIPGQGPRALPLPPNEPLR